VTTETASPELALALERIAERYDRTWLDSDPLRWPRRYAGAADREVAAVVASSLAYGRVAHIQDSIGRTLAALGPSPAATLAATARREVARRLRRVRHRWTSGSDVAWLLHAVARAQAAHGGVGAIVLRSAEGPEPLREGLAAWHRFAHEGPPARDLRRRRARAFLIPDPRGGAACQRLLLLARWCLRPDDGLDLGLWAGGALAPRDLVVPLDVHMHRIARLLRLTRRRTTDWRAAEEVTSALRRFAPDDPVRFDFALVRPGIVGRCRYRHDAEVCGACDLRRVCPQGRLGARSRT
jgi:uncharacterized protein (TIGR02757 family)